eukprot:gene45654-58953_t
MPPQQRQCCGHHSVARQAGFIADTRADAVAVAEQLIDGMTNVSGTLQTAGDLLNSYNIYRANARVGVQSAFGCIPPPDTVRRPGRRAW